MRIAISNVCTSSGVSEFACVSVDSEFACVSVDSDMACVSVDSRRCEPLANPMDLHHVGCHS